MNHVTVFKKNNLYTYVVYRSYNMTIMIASNQIIKSKVNLHVCKTRYALKKIIKFSEFIYPLCLKRFFY